METISAGRVAATIKAIRTKYKTPLTVRAIAVQANMPEDTLTSFLRDKRGRVETINKLIIWLNENKNRYKVDHTEIEEAQEHGPG